MLRGSRQIRYSHPNVARPPTERRDGKRGTRNSFAEPFAPFLDERVERRGHDQENDKQITAVTLFGALAFLAASPAMVHIRRQILQIAPVDVPVFISGESGVGKEVVARMIHIRSTRYAQPFVKVNCLLMCVRNGAASGR